MTSKVLADERDDLTRDVVRFEPRRRRQVDRPVLAEGGLVFRVEVPAPARRLAVDHQDVVPPALQAIEVLHPQGLPTLGVVAKLADGAEEMTVVAHVQRHAALPGDALQVLQDAPVARRRHHELLGPPSRERTTHLAAESPAVARAVQADIVDAASPCAEFAGEVPHGREKLDDADAARPDMRGLFPDFGHQHHVVVALEVVERARIDVQLVAQHEDEAAHRPPRDGGWLGARLGRHEVGHMRGAVALPARAAHA